MLKCSFLAKYFTPPPSPYQYLKKHIRRSKRLAERPHIDLQKNTSTIRVLTVRPNTLHPPTKISTVPPRHVLKPPQGLIKVGLETTHDCRIFPRIQHENKTSWLAVEFQPTGWWLSFNQPIWKIVRYFKLGSSSPNFRAWKFQKIFELPPSWLHLIFRRAFKVSSLIFPVKHLKRQWQLWINCCNWKETKVVLFFNFWLPTFFSPAPKTKQKKTFLDKLPLTIYQHFFFRPQKTELQKTSSFHLPEKQMLALYSWLELALHWYDSRTIQPSPGSRAPTIHQLQKNMLPEACVTSTIWCVCVFLPKKNAANLNVFKCFGDFFWLNRLVSC